MSFLSRSAELLPSRRAQFEDGGVTAEQLSLIADIDVRRVKQGQHAYASYNDLSNSIYDLTTPKGGLVVHENDSSTFFIDDPSYVQTVDRLLSLQPTTETSPQSLEPAYDRALARVTGWRRRGNALLGLTLAGPGGHAIFLAPDISHGVAGAAGGVVAAVAEVIGQKRYRTGLARTFASQIEDLRLDYYINNRDDDPYASMVNVGNTPVSFSELTAEEAAAVSGYQTYEIEHRDQRGDYAFGQARALTRPRVLEDGSMDYHTTVHVGMLLNKMLDADQEPGELWITMLRDSAIDLAEPTKGLKEVDRKLLKQDGREKLTDIEEEESLDRLSAEWDGHAQQIRKILIPLVSQVSARHNIQKLEKALEEWGDSMGTITELTDFELRHPMSQYIQTFKLAAYDMGLKLPKDTAEQVQFVRDIFSYVMSIRNHLPNSDEWLTMSVDQIDKAAKVFYDGLVKRFGVQMAPYYEAREWDEFKQGYHPEESPPSFPEISVDTADYTLTQVDS